MVDKLVGKLSYTQTMEQVSDILEKYPAIESDFFMKQTSAGQAVEGYCHFSDTIADYGSSPLDVQKSANFFFENMDQKMKALDLARANYWEINKALAFYYNQLVDMSEDQEDNFVKMVREKLEVSVTSVEQEKTWHQEAIPIIHQHMAYVESIIIKLLEEN
ncbi:hypothetical protein [Vagococcus intermedius]|uniref:Uncharacterized protein n=1 Tax=Vagococcus intermedius TaxID=2991418 RepID=A0AAF0I7U3_9ENTE|nr:hypothetical protein [Vagococcus intermedius]WEG73635.1 hypothetical protein OL234_01635 [Vagococcus intermedius]WEG75719.1 hypothetical protein OL235_01645 [Vagococcus intermedius]